MPEIDQGHEYKRAALRVLGPVVIVIALIMMGVGLATMIASTNSTPKMPEMPDMPGWGTPSVRIEYPKGISEEEKRQIAKAMGEEYKGSGDTESESSEPNTANFLWFVFGLPVLGVGIGITRFAYMGAVARYEAAEVAPVAVDTFNYAATGAGEGIKTVAKAIGEGGGHPEEAAINCTKCWTSNAPDARFCKGCAAPLQAECPKCGTMNDPDARFCDHCGESLG